MDTKLTNLKDNLEPLFEQFKEMIRVETVVGEPVQFRGYYDCTICGCIPWFRGMPKSWRWRSES